MHVYEKYKHFKINISVLRSGYTLCVFCQMQLIKATCYIYVYNALTVIIFIVIAFNLLVYIVNNVLKSPYVVNHCLCVIKSFFHVVFEKKYLISINVSSVSAFICQSNSSVLAVRS